MYNLLGNDIQLCVSKMTIILPVVQEGAFGLVSWIVGAWFVVSVGGARYICKEDITLFQ